MENIYGQWYSDTELFSIVMAENKELINSDEWNISQICYFSVKGVTKIRVMQLALC